MTNRAASSHEPGLLQLSAPLARRLAGDSCAGECRWYHGLWQYLRLLGLIDPMPRHAAFFGRALRAAAAGRPAPRVLVCGAADASMYSQVMQGLRAPGVRPAVTVIDLCGTPLAVNRWYAARAAARVSTRRIDVLKHRPRQAYDAICTHALLGRFAPSARPRLLKQWHALLRPGGSVVTVTPIRPGSARTLVGFSPQQARAFAEVVRKAAQRRADMLALEPEELARMALAYALRHRVHRVESPDALRGLFEAAGFRVAHLSLVAASRAPGRPFSGPTVAGSAPYARIVATRV
jgi:SAM-dependent methyltransferase